MIEKPPAGSMQPVWKFLARLREMNMTVSSEDGRLRVSAPPGVLTSELREELTERKAEILEFLRDVREAYEQPAPPLRPIPRNEPLELSFSQQRLWMLDQMAQGPSPYHVSLNIQFDGPLSVAAIRSAIAGLVCRHESLRTSFPSIEGRPVQDIGPFYEPDVPLTDLSGGGSSEQREAEALGLAMEESRKPYGLANGPLTRWQLYRLGPDLHILWVGMHHIITDGWSLSVIYSELAELYGAALKGRSASLRDLPIQYADFAAWQRNWLSGEVLRKQLDYWSSHLAGISTLELPADRPYPAEPSFRGLGERISLSGEVLAAIKRLASEEKATLFMTLLAGFQALLQRYTGQDDIVVGSPIANRNRSEIEELVGFFVNSLVLRADLSGNPTFREIIRRVREVTLKAYEFQDMPFEKLVEELAPERNYGQNPLFQVMFALQNLPPRRPLEVAGLRMSSVGSKALTSRLEMEMHLWETKDGLAGQLVYSTDRFDGARIARMAGHYCRILKGVSKQPDRRLSELPLLTDEEHERLLVEWNQTATEYPRDKRVHQLFERQAQRRPNAIALCSDRETITYGELNGRANQFAAYLRDHGVGVGTRVGICMERSPEMICGILGILKAGAAYVPLDPSYPKERLNFMIKDSEAPLAVTVEPFEEVLCESGVKVISLSRDWPLVERHSPENVAIPMTEGALAYVIYTSGSTGTPKGVAVPHRAIARLVFNTNYIELGPADCVAHLSQVCFDAATFEIWGALLNGARLVVISSEVALEPELFGAALKHHAVSTLFVTTALFNELAAWKGSVFKGIKQVLFGGEAVNPRWVGHVLESGPPQRLLHVYGPTECTTFATFYPVEHVPVDVTTIPIGRPISNTTAYVLDKDRNPVPVGVAGELYLGGGGLAQGYLNRPELTREKFVADPFSADNGERLYRTGDIVKYLLDGNIEFIGRADHQVKIRGFRIEPGEVEVVLRRHPEVEDAVIIAREDEPGERQLAAYIVPRNGSAPRQWRDFLRGKLPAYMIPSAFVELEALPTTASGKVDKLALPKPERRSGENFAGAELTPTQQIVSNIWANVLHTENFGIETSFFELGGHSLLAIQVVTALRRILQIEIPANALFNNPTVSSLSRHLDQLVAQNLETVRPPIERVSRDEPLPLSFAQERLWRNERNAATPDNVSVIVLDLEGDLNIPCLERSLQELMRRHELFRTTFHLIGGVPVQRIAPYQPVALDVIDLSQLEDAQAEAARFALKEKTDPISLEHGPLARFSVLRFGARHHRLVMKLHHILYDIWSLPIFRRELDALYMAFCAGEDSPLRELTVQLGDFAVWQRRYLAPDSSAFQAQLAYWREQLSGNLAVLRLPCERPSELKTASAADVLAPFELSEELSANIRALTRSEGTTLFITFLTALKALINLSTGQNDIMLGTYLAKRNVPGSEGMMGYFCDIGLLRTRVSSHLSFLELLRAVRETVLNAYAHEDMPFDVLAEQFQKLGQVQPALRAIFMFETLSGIPSRLGDLQVNYLPVATGNTMPWRFQMRVRDEGRAFSGRAKFNACLHDPHLVRRMMRNYVRLLEAVAKNPTARLSDVEGELGSW
jgi:amino acid adenylation domain-containing protein